MPLNKHKAGVRGAHTSSAVGLVCMVTVQVPQEHEARPVDGRASASPQL